MFLDLCRQFKEENIHQFKEKFSAFAATSSTPNGNLCVEKLTICAFLTRVMHGEKLDVEFEEEAGVMPLMSAAKVWSSLEGAVEKEMFKNIAQLLLVQKWTLQLDKYLETGVKCHGQGSWSRILMDFDFDGRTGTMLKDRWRVLKKKHKV
ncbi:Telomeric repeat-binding factor 1 [Liparis tanakae]|uniref:Telomeric repeat-binding factor 1 n=1 Tax=Liparis tanakae TaxID=230148 RepID=A0A4Z2JFE3_9TELE|nr:Telomeric repeat-binding factor 1 [Liparis tanakae]